MKANLFIKLILILLACCIFVTLNGQTTHYIDPSQAINGNGEIGTPYNTFPTQLVTGHKYLVKRGTTLILATPLLINTNNVTISSYELGALPTIKCSQATSILEIQYASNTTIQDLHLEGNVSNNSDYGINVLGTSGVTTSCVIDYCFIDQVETGILAQSFENLTVMSSIINSTLNGIDINDVNTLFITQNHINVLYDGNITSDRFVVRINGSDDFEVSHNQLYLPEPNPGFIFYGVEIIGQGSGFYNNICLGSEYTHAGLLLGVAISYIYNNYIVGCDVGIMNDDLNLSGMPTNFAVMYIYNNIINNCTSASIVLDQSHSSGYFANIFLNTISSSFNTADYIALKCIGDGTGSGIWSINNVYHLGNLLGKVMVIPEFNWGYFQRDVYPPAFSNYITCNNNNYSLLADFTNSPYAIVWNPLEYTGNSPFNSTNLYTDEDFRLDPSSVCIDAAVDVTSTYPFYNKTDYFGNFRPSTIPPQGISGIDIGAIEFYDQEINSIGNLTGWYYATDEIIKNDLLTNNLIHHKGNIYHGGDLEYIRGINLVGITSESMSALALDEYGINDMLNKVQSMGYNTLRISFPINLVIDQVQNVSALIPTGEVNSTYSGNDAFYTSANYPKTMYEALEIIIDKCNLMEPRLNVILSIDGIEAEPGNDESGLWYDNPNYVNESEYIEALVYLASDFQYDNIIGLSLINEPYNAVWDGSNSQSDFRRFLNTAGFIVRYNNPSWMIFAEGIQDHNCPSKYAEEEFLSQYSSTSLGIQNSSVDEYGKAENLATFGYNPTSSSVDYYPLNHNNNPSHKLVFSPHSNQFEEYFVIDSLANDDSKIKEVNDYRWGYLSKDYAVVLGEFGAIYGTENEGIQLVEQAEYSEEWFKYFVQYLSELKVPGACYMAFNGNNTYTVTDANNNDHIYSQSMMQPTNWLQEKSYKLTDNAVLFGRVSKSISSSVGGSMYSPRDGTTYSFNAGCFNTTSLIEHVAHWAGEGDGNDYGHDVLEALAYINGRHRILHEFKVTSSQAAISDFNIEVVYTDNELGYVCENTLRFYKYDSGNNTWNCLDDDPLNYTVAYDYTENKVTLTTGELGIYAIFGRVASQVTHLNSNWNLWSTYIHPVDLSVESVFEDVATPNSSTNNLILVKDQLGNIYWPEYGLDAIGDIEDGLGYQVKMTNPFDLIIAGNYIYPQTNPICLIQGWGIFGVLSTEAILFPSDVIGLNISQISQISDDQNGVYYPPYSTSIQLVPGEGYKVKYNLAPLSPQTCTDAFSYYNLQNSKSTPNSDSSKFIFAYYTQDLYINTDNNMVVIVPYECWEDSIGIGSEIVAIGEHNQIVGKCIFNGGNTIMIVNGDDKYTANVVENLVDGESFTFQIYNSYNKVKKTFKIKSWKNNYGKFVKNDVAIADSPSTRIELLLNAIVTPNPNEGQFKLNFDSKFYGEANVSISEINGRTILTEKISIEEGHNFKEYNFTGLKSGIYIIEIVTNENRQFLKIAIL